jgi:alpha-tubulin suppressor-like RCC1 family protein
MNLQRSFTSESKHSLFLTDDGTLYGWGLLDQKHTTPVPIKLPKINNETPKIISLASGMYHAIILTHTQNFIGWGANGSGQLGPRDEEGSAAAEILKISIPEPVMQVFASASVSGAITREGSVYLWGTRFGKIPKKLEIPEPVTAAVGGLEFQLMLTKSGNVYGLGDNLYNQISPCPTWFIREPTLVPHLPTTCLTKIYAGCRHGFALTTSGGLLAWGCNSYGNLGVGDAKFRELPEYIFQSGVVDMASGWGHALALMDDGSLRIWGCDFDGQLAQMGTLELRKNGVFQKLTEIPLPS